MNHDYETGVALSDSVSKTCVKCPLADKSRWRHFRLAIKPRYLGNHAPQIKMYYGTHNQEVMVAPSESVMKNRLKRPLAEKSRWRHIRLAIKPRYIGNHASQIKSYYGTLTGSHVRSFWIRDKKFAWSVSWWRNHDDVISVWIYKTSLSRKPFIPDKKLLWNAISKSWSLFQNPS